jgi:hypothetical protein
MPLPARWPPRPWLSPVPPGPRSRGAQAAPRRPSCRVLAGDSGVALQSRRSWVSHGRQALHLHALDARSRSSDGDFGAAARRAGRANAGPLCRLGSALSWNRLPIGQPRNPAPTLRSVGSCNPEPAAIGRVWKPRPQGVRQVSGLPLLADSEPWLMPSNSLALSAVTAQCKLSPPRKQEPDHLHAVNYTNMFIEHQLWQDIAIFTVHKGPQRQGPTISSYYVRKKRHKAGREWHPTRTPISRCGAPGFLYYAASVD